MEKKKSNTLIKLENILNNGEYVLLNDYINTNTKIKLKHLECGNIWDINPLNFVHGNRCPKCSNKNKGQYHKHNIEEIKDYINSFKNYKCLSKEYINNNTKLEVKHLECGNIYYVTFINFKKGRRCPYCKKSKPKKTNEYFLNKFNKNSDSIFYKPLEEYKGIDTKIKFKHLECGNIFEMTPNMFNSKGRRCPYCKKYSNSERRIIEFLKQNKISFEKEFYYKDLLSDKGYPLRFDFKINLNNEKYFLLEYDGEQHFRKSGFYTEEMVNDLQKRDEMKNKYCKNNNIKLIRISYKNKNHLEDILEKTINSTTIETK